MRKHVTANGSTFGFRPDRECGPQVVDGEPAVESIERIKRASQDGSGCEHGTHGQYTHACDDADDHQVLEPVPDRWKPALGCRAGG